MLTCRHATPCLLLRHIVELACDDCLTMAAMDVGGFFGDLDGCLIDQ